MTLLRDYIETEYASKRQKSRAYVCFEDQTTRDFNKTDTSSTIREARNHLCYYEDVINDISDNILYKYKPTIYRKIVFRIWKLKRFVYNDSGNDSEYKEYHPEDSHININLFFIDSFFGFKHANIHKLETSQTTNKKNRNRDLLLMNCSWGYYITYHEFCAVFQNFIIYNVATNNLPDSLPDCLLLNNTNLFEYKGWPRKNFFDLCLQPELYTSNRINQFFRLFNLYKDTMKLLPGYYTTKEGGDILNKFETMFNPGCYTLPAHSRGVSPFIPTISAQTSFITDSRYNFNYDSQYSMYKYINSVLPRLLASVDLSKITPNTPLSLASICIKNILLVNVHSFITPYIYDQIPFLMWNPTEPFRYYGLNYIKLDDWTNWTTDTHYYINPSFSRYDGYGTGQRYSEPMEYPTRASAFSKSVVIHTPTLSEWKLVYNPKAIVSKKIENDQNVIGSIFRPVLPSPNHRGYSRDDDDVVDMGVDCGNLIDNDEGYYERRTCNQQIDQIICVCSETIKGKKCTAINHIPPTSLIGECSQQQQHKQQLHQQSITRPIHIPKGLFNIKKSHIITKTPPSTCFIGEGFNTSSGNVDTSTLPLGDEETVQYLIRRNQSCFGCIVPEPIPKYVTKLNDCSYSICSNAIYELEQGETEQQQQYYDVLLEYDEDNAYFEALQYDDDGDDDGC